MDTLEMNKQKLSDYFFLVPLKMTAQLESYKLEDALYKTTIPMHNHNYIFGIEVEAENIHKVDDPTHKFYWDFVIDNSLRNHGLEFVSKPLKAFQLEYALDQLYTVITKHQQPEFTPRTSTHVHMNVRDLTMSQIFNLVLIYTSVENVLFNWVGHNRDKNIFCIKLTDTEYIHTYTDLITNPTRAAHYWNKYTALNLKPMESKGTVEFRHLFGTWDKETILLWINLLSCIKTYARNKNTKDLYKEIQDLNTNSLYEEYLYSIFGQYTKHLTKNIINLQDLLEDSITYVKLSTLVKKKELPTFNPTATVRPILDNGWEPFNARVRGTRIDRVPDVPEEVAPDMNIPLTAARPPVTDWNDLYHDLMETQMQAAQIQTQAPRALVDEVTRRPFIRPTTGRTNPSLEERAEQRRAARELLIRGIN